MARRSMYTNALGSRKPHGQILKALSTLCAPGSDNVSVSMTSFQQVKAKWYTGFPIINPMDSIICEGPQSVKAAMQHARNWRLSSVVSLIQLVLVECLNRSLYLQRTPSMLTTFPSPGQWSHRYAHQDSTPVNQQYLKI